MDTIHGREHAGVDQQVSRLHPQRTLPHLRAASPPELPTIRGGHAVRVNGVATCAARGAARAGLKTGGPPIRRR